MTNPYYNYTNDLIPDTPARSRPLDVEFTKIEEGFDKLSAPAAVNTGTTIFSEDSGSADTIVTTNTVNTSSELVDGQLIALFPNATNTGATTLAHNGGAAKPVLRNNGTPLQGGDLVEGRPVILIRSEAEDSWYLTAVTEAQTAAVSRPTVITDATTARTLSATDERAIILFSNSSDSVATIPNDATLNLPVGYIVHMHATNTGQLTVAFQAGVTLNFAIADGTRARYSSISLIKVAADSWILIGDQG